MSLYVLDASYTWGKRIHGDAERSLTTPSDKHHLPALHQITAILFRHVAALRSRPRWGSPGSLDVSLTRSNPSLCLKGAFIAHCEHA